MQTNVLIPPVRPRADSAGPCDDETFLSQFGQKDRKGYARRLAVYEEKLGAAAAERWGRIAHFLMSLAPYPAKLVGQEAIQFYIPDGKYHMQVFALQVMGDGVLAVYAGNVLAAAMRTGILGGPNHVDGGTFYRIGKAGESLWIDALDRQTLNPAPACKAMTGWHRQAICITLPADATNTQIVATENLCALAAMEWATAA